ncbi:membrane protein [Staphylococcus aureus subsp. aureus ST 1413]|nr:membrane protein [Staphylococcus aureus subsp. aureus ST 1413]
MNILRYLLGIGFSVIGVLHFTRERQFRNIIPKCLPLRKTAVLVTGIFEILFGLALLIKKTISMLEKYNQSILASCIPS